MSKRLNTTDQLGCGDQIVIYKGNCTDFRGLPQDIFVAAVTDQVLEQIVIPDTNDQPMVQQFYPNADFKVEVENYKSGTYLLLNPYNGIENGEIVLPFQTDLTDKQEVLVTSTQQINNLKVNPNGASIVGEPNAMAASGFFKLKYVKTTGTWYRVG